MAYYMRLLVFHSCSKGFFKGMELCLIQVPLQLNVPLLLLLLLLPSILYAVINFNIFILLLHVVGRRNLQVRLVEPSVRSLNSGDCFALVTEKDLFSWIGRDCNPYEKAKVSICSVELLLSPSQCKILAYLPLVKL